MTTLRLATRKSEMAVLQANMVGDALQQAHPGLNIELVKCSTKGDEITDRPLADIGGKALFVKTLQRALIEGRADLAVHSVKDMPAALDPHFSLVGVLPRPTAADAFVSHRYACFADLPQGAVVGTSSPRRQAQSHALRPDLKIEPVRGNVQTRLSKLDEGLIDALLLSAAGLERLSLSARITEVLPFDTFLPAVGQGSVGIEIMTECSDMQTYVAPINHEASFCAVRAERALVATLNGDCHSPIAAHATLSDGQLHVRGWVGSASGSQAIFAEVTGHAHQPEYCGQRCAQQLNEQGAQALLQEQP